MIKWQGKCKLALAFVAAAAMLGTAWAAGVSYDSGDRIELGSIESGSVLSPSANGSNTITFTGTEGGEAEPSYPPKISLSMERAATSRGTPRLPWIGRRSWELKIKYSFSPAATAGMFPAIPA